MEEDNGAAAASLNPSRYQRCAPSLRLEVHDVCSRVIIRRKGRLIFYAIHHLDVAAICTGAHLHARGRVIDLPLIAQRAVYGIQQNRERPGRSLIICHPPAAL